MVVFSILYRQGLWDPSYQGPRTDQSCQKKLVWWGNTYKDSPDKFGSEGCIYPLCITLSEHPCALRQACKCDFLLVSHPRNISVRMFLFQARKAKQLSPAQPVSLQVLLWPGAGLAWARGSSAQLAAVPWTPLARLHESPKQSKPDQESNKASFLHTHFTFLLLAFINCSISSCHLRSSALQSDTSACDSSGFKYSLWSTNCPYGGRFSQLSYWI